MIRDSYFIALCSFIDMLNERPILWCLLRVFFFVVTDEAEGIFLYSSVQTSQQQQTVKLNDNYSEETDLFSMGISLA